MTQRILVAGVGNIFLGDDAFGVELAQLLLRRGYPPEVEVVDFGIRGTDLAYALLDDYDALNSARCGAARRRARHALRDRAGGA